MKFRLISNQLKSEFLSMVDISIVSPVYMGESLLNELVDRVRDSVIQIVDNFELILVEDGSPDHSWEVIEELSEKYPEIKGIKLSRNFGQHYAITAGLDHAQGEWVVVMDCDLQDRPEEIERLYQEARKGYDIVLARRHQRQDNFLKRSFSRLFYKVLSYLTGTKQDPAVANFGIYHRSVIDAIGQMREYIRYFPTMVNWVGFKVTKLDVEHSSRAEGKTSYNFKKLLHLAMDIVLAFSDKPIRLVIKAGLIVSIFSFGFAIFELIQWLKGEIVVLGYASLIISIWFLSGIILSTLGLIGLYVGKTFEGVKRRPIYLIARKTNAKRS
ncbi:glycosyltransferase family 2 protein [Halocola ammonii]